MVCPSSTCPLAAVSVSSSGGGAGDLHRLGHLADFELYVETRLFSGAQHNAVLHVGLETSRFDLKLVGSRIQIGDVPCSFFGGHRCEHKARRRIRAP